jgi:hypothetical protein
VNPFENEEVMWQRLKDVQREAENRRLYGSAPSIRQVVRLLASRAWLLAGLAMRRSPRRTWLDKPAERKSRAA